MGCLDKTPRELEMCVLDTACTILHRVWTHWAYYDIMWMSLETRSCLADLSSGRNLSPHSRLARVGSTPKKESFFFFPQHVTGPLLELQTPTASWRPLPLPPLPSFPSSFALYSPLPRSFPLTPSSPSQPHSFLSLQHHFSTTLDTSDTLTMVSSLPCYF